MYCQQRGISDPVYTQYSNFDGYRNEVEVDGLSFFGVEKCYPSIDEAIIGCAHKALHHLLVTGGANEELMYRVAKSGALPKVVGATPILPNKPEPVTVDLVSGRNCIFDMLIRRLSCLHWCTVDMSANHMCRRNFHLSPLPALLSSQRGHVEKAEGAVERKRL